MNWSTQLIKSTISRQFSRYILASAIALSVDYVTYWSLANASEISLPSAAAIGYCIGLIVAYFLIAGRVFKEGWLCKKRYFEALLFLLSGLLGVLLTYATVFFYVRVLGVHLHGQKLLAISISFIGVYLFRKYLIFRKRFNES